MGQGSINNKINPLFMSIIRTLIIYVSILKIMTTRHTFQTVLHLG